MIRSLLTALLLAFSSANALGETSKSAFGITYADPVGEQWDVSNKENEDRLVVNWATIQYPKKEFSILVKKQETQDIRSEDVFNGFKKRMPPQSVFSDPEFSEEYGAESLIVGFYFPSGKNTLYGKAIITFANGFMYNVILSRYYEPVEEDKELMGLLNAIQIH